MGFNIVDSNDIVEGRVTDAYFERAEEALEYADENPIVTADISADQFPTGRQEVLAGVNNVASLLAEVTENITAWSLPEGALFDGVPVLRIQGPYRDFARYETCILGFLSQASGIATNALCVTQVADEFDDTNVLSFGSRHMHPAIAAMIERSALIGGVDGFSNIIAEEKFGYDSSGTMPHALMLSFGEHNRVKAWKSFNEGTDSSVPTIILADTFGDERVEVMEAVQTFGDEIDGVRLDTTGSRRGDFEHIIKEIKWMLDVYLSEHREISNDVDIFISGGLGPEDVKKLGNLVDGFGIGSYISNAEPVDFSLDIVSREGEPITKRGKLEGIKSVVGNPMGKKKLRVGGTGHPGSGQFEKIVENGVVRETFSIEEAKNLAKRFAKNTNFNPY